MNTALRLPTSPAEIIACAAIAQFLFASAAIESATAFGALLAQPEKHTGADLVEPFNARLQVLRRMLPRAA